MANYKNLRQYSADEVAWISQRLLRLRRTIRASDLGRRNHDNLVIGSWNIRAFDDGAPRRDESYHYIAEIIDHFDICAVQEVKKDLAPLKRLVNLLGPNWDYFVTDVTEGTKGNHERQAFLYNKSRVWFRNLVGEITLASDALVNGEQIARTPYFASFQAGWFKFTLCSVHIIYGGTSAAKKRLRTKEIAAIAQRIVERARDEGEVYVLIGDMNIEKRGGGVFKALSDNGLYVPLFGPTNLGGDKAYDQIAFTSEDVRTDYVRSGVIDWRNDVYGDADNAHYEAIIQEQRIKEGKSAYSNWGSAYQNYFASFEMSDHLPVWVEIKTDYSDRYLDQFTAGT